MLDLTSLVSGWKNASRLTFFEKLAERLIAPRVPKDALHGLRDPYKIKLRTGCYRCVYRVEDQTVTVTVVAVRKRDGGEVYAIAGNRR